MDNQKIYLSCLTGISLLIGASTVQSMTTSVAQTQFRENPNLHAIVAIKPDVGNQLRDRIISQNKGFWRDIKDGFEDVKDDAEEVGEDVRDDAVDVGEEVKDDSVEIGEDVKDDAVDVGEEVGDDADDVKEDIED